MGEDFKTTFGSGDAVNVFIHPGGQGGGCILVAETLVEIAVTFKTEPIQEI